MDKTQAYNFFLNGLKKKLLTVAHKLDEVETASPQYASLMDEHTRLQGLLATLDDIANSV
jgi:hypothetical protein